jgi:hypothetical protein
MSRKLWNSLLKMSFNKEQLDSRKIKKGITKTAVSNNISWGLYYKTYVIYGFL